MLKQSRDAQELLDVKNTDSPGPTPRDTSSVGRGDSLHLSRALICTLGDSDKNYQRTPLEKVCEKDTGPVNRRPGFESSCVTLEKSLDLSVPPFLSIV